MKMRNVVGSVAATLAALSVLVVAGNAQAQDAATAPAAAAPAAAAPSGGTDHDSVVGHIGVGWFGVGSIPIGDLKTTISTPAIGIRYWLQDGLGLDVGVGFNTQSGSTKAGSVSTDDPSQLGFWLHAGVPIKLGDAGKHLVFLVTPEANLGIASGSVPGGQGVKDGSTSGFLLQVGARAGAELQFGFIGIPQLALEGSVGLFLQDESASTTPPGPNQTETTHSQLTIATSSINQPWDFFKGTVAARYYF